MAHNRLGALRRAPAPARRAHFAAIGQWRGLDPSASFATGYAAARLAEAGVRRRGSTWATFLREPATAQVRFHPLQVAEPPGLEVAPREAAPLAALAAGMAGVEAAGRLHPLLADQDVVAEPQLAGLYEQITAARAGSGPVPSRHAEVLLVNGDAHCPACTQYRVLNPLAALRAAGIDACAIDGEDVHNLAGTRLAADVTIVSRALWSKTLADHLAALRAAGSTLVFDVDDLLFDGPRVLASLQPGASQRERLDARPGSEMGRDSMRRVASLCHAATFPTDALAAAWSRSAPGSGATTLPSFLSDEQLAVARTVSARTRRHDESSVVIGYSSGSATHGGDFATVAPALAEVMSRHRQVRLHVFGPLALDELRELEPVRSRITHDPTLTRRWDRLMARMAGCDLNIVPLELDNGYCRCKSEVKYLEAGAVGVPTLAAAVPAYRRAIGDDRTGMLARCSSDWERALETMLTDADLRAHAGRRALEDVRTRYGARSEMGRRYVAHVRALLAGHPAAPPEADGAAEHVFSPRVETPPEGAPVLVAVGPSADDRPDPERVRELIAERWSSASLIAAAETPSEVPTAEAYAERPWRPGFSEVDLATGLRSAAAVLTLGDPARITDAARSCGVTTWPVEAGPRIR